MSVSRYNTSVIFCDCLECPYNNFSKDYTCTKKEIYLDDGDCRIAKDIKNQKGGIDKCSYPCTI